ncbi:hypothetical protein IGI04_014369, partial [Brassica rapa subsp. trilocularis]
MSSWNGGGNLQEGLTNDDIVAWWFSLVPSERSEAVGTIALRFEGAFFSVASGARLSISTGLGLQGSSLTLNES